MNPSAAVYLDTNILIALIEGPEADEHGLNAFVDAAWRDGIVHFQTSELCLAELLVLPYRNSDKALIAQYLRLFSQREKLTVIPIDRPILDIAAVLRTKVGRLKLPDAIHLATACAGNCPYFLTLDSDFKDLAPMQHPFFQNVTFPSVKIIRPDPDTLSELLKAHSS